MVVLLVVQLIDKLVNGILSILILRFTDHLNI